MQSERKRILTMLENGTITTEEALTLLEALEKPQQQAQTPQQEIVKSNDQTEHQDERKEQPSGKSHTTHKKEQMDDFLQDLQKDFIRVGDRFMQFMQSAVQRVKTFDFDAPFGDENAFNHQMTKEIDENLDEILINIDNGSVTVQPGDDNEVKALFSVKPFNRKTLEENEEEFHEKLIFMYDHGKLRLMSDLKWIQVNVELYVPKRHYDKISARLLNGHLTVENLQMQRLYGKSANGKIELNGLHFGELEVETGNGSIRLKESEGKEVVAETMNGRVYLNGILRDVEAKSINGHVVVTTTDEAAEKIEAKTVSGTVEIYIPSDIPIVGEMNTNMGQLDLKLNDVTKTNTTEQFLQKSISFKKELDMDSEQLPLHIEGETKSGSVIVCYNLKEQATS